LKKRHGVLGLLCVVSVITFLDRLALPLAEPGIRKDLHLSPEQWGWVLSSYVLANALFEIPSGALGDRNGQRLELTRITLWWSAFTALTGWCRTFLQMFGARFLFGVGAAGAYPNAAGVISRWFPKREHARAQGFVWGASRLGGALAPLLLVPLQRLIGWRGVFAVLGLLGGAWSATWWLWFRNLPAQMPGITPQELSDLGSAHQADDTQALHHAIPWRRLFALPQLWLIALAYFCYAWGSWFYYAWFTTWLVRGVGLSIQQMSLFASLPFLMGLAGNLVGGEVSERLVTRHGPRNTYRWVTVVCLVGTSALLLAMSIVHGHAAVVILATLGFGVMDLMLPSAWAMCMSLGGRFGGTATGMMNTAGNLGGWVCTVAFGYVIHATNNYNLPVRGVAAMVFVAAILFSQVDCTRSLKDDPA
jgi:ACS family glucarate transporter-like MFS transporter